jgi:conjugative transfer signal peptidase TraF
LRTSRQNMGGIYKHLMKWMLPAIALVLVIINTTHLFYFNFYTHSLPNGIYIRKCGVPHIGDYAVSCLTPKVAQYGIDRGYLIQGGCDSGSVAVLKIIKGMPGDKYSLRNGQLSVNGMVYLSEPKDSKGRPLEWLYSSKEGVLGSDQYLLISSHVKNSWDSRYWGPVPVKYIVQPLWIYENDKKN